MESMFGMFRVVEPENLYYWNDAKAGRTVCGYKKVSHRDTSCASGCAAKSSYP